MEVNYIALAIPAFFLLIGIELAYSLWKGRKLYRLNDSITNIGLGVGQQVTGIFLKTALFFGYLFLYEHHRLFTLENTVLNWVLLFLAVDFFYYWFHRMSHQVNALWAAHVVHHQSEEYNLSVALRQSWLQNAFSWAFYVPLALAGFAPVMFLTVSAFNTLYQFWIHTRTIGRMGPLEWVFNTPSHHRVHHGSNPKYIDRNHAGSLIIWDRMFGTFQEEKEEVVYGITTPLASWNPVWANVHYWNDLWDLAKRSKGVKDKVLVFLRPPGWQPDYLGGRQYAKEVTPERMVKYDSNAIDRHWAYVVVMFTVQLGIATALLFFEAQLSWAETTATGLYVLYGLLTLGGLFENRPWAIPAEYGRIMATLLVALLFWESAYADDIMRYAGIFAIVNFFWFARIVRQLRNAGQPTSSYTPDTGHT
ncbi:MAG: sterol desaturase family protein [Flavobacteriales bacterium]|nr:sterol desaturase family protein [Flavobacteriales bacterium]